jgi:hypothetical protein
MVRNVPSGGPSLISTQIARVSAGLLLLGGLMLLFASDVILPRLIPTFPVSGAWLGQLLAASWLALAALDWLSQRQLLGGIYGRHVVMANAMLYFITTMVLLRIVVQYHASTVFWLVLAPAVLFAGIYWWLLFRGPFERDFQNYRGAQEER